VSANGTLTVTSYTTGLASSTAYKDATVYYPSNGTGPYVVVAIVPGFTTPASLMAPWGRFMASHGYVGVTAGPPSESDSPEARSNALWAVITNMKAENTRAGGPLNGKISDCFAVMGHSMGGGGSLLATNAHPADIKAAIPLNPYQPAGRFPNIVGATLVLTGQNDTTASPTAHGRPHYDSIPATTIKQYVEAASGNHQSAFSPNGLTARYAVSWLKYNVDGDARYRPFLDRAATGISNFATTVK
jgi:pimeloyl-ACP methyl ester carboxylesterase